MPQSDSQFTFGEPIESDAVSWIGSTVSDAPKEGFEFLPAVPALAPPVLPAHPTSAAERWRKVVGELPPWLTSVLLHLVVLICLALIILPNGHRLTLNLNAIFADRLGEQTDELLLSLDRVEVAEEQTFDASLVEMPPVDSPLFSPPDLTLATEGTTTSHLADAPRIAMALTGREPGRKEALLKAFGGNEETELAVALGLEWLARNQRREGNWSLRGPYKSGAEVENREAATGLALLAFQGAGNTSERGRYQEVVSSGWRYLLHQQTDDGCFYQSGEFNHRFYTQSIVTLGLCELYAMTRDEALKAPAQRAVDYLVVLQNPQGGWRYDPAVDADTSVTGWVLLALQSAQAAGLHVPSKVFDRVSHYLDLAASYDGSRYGYKPGHAESLSMTAEGLLCRQYLGWQRDDARLEKGVAYLRNNLVQYREPNAYYWYYATQVMHHMEGDAWTEWNQVMRELVPKEQVRNGREKGSWYSNNDRWGITGGRLFNTCLHIYMLEVYYRHLPIYSPVFRFGDNRRAVAD